MGDSAVNIAQGVLRLNQDLPLEPRFDLPALAGIARAMVHDAVRAFDEEDTRRAQQVMHQDDRVDSLNAEIFRRLLEVPGTDAACRARTMSLMLMARSLERIADHATNICEEVYYLVEGADIRHQESV